MSRKRKIDEDLRRKLQESAPGGEAGIGRPVEPPRTMVQGQRTANDDLRKRLEKGGSGGEAGIGRPVEPPGTMAQGEQLSLGGKDVSIPTKVDDTSNVRSAIEQYQGAGGEAPSGPGGGYQSQYQGTIDSLLDKVLNPAEFEYDVENDPAFQSYKDQYTRAGERAHADSSAQTAALTGGRQSSWAVSAGHQARQQWDDRLMDRVPELEQMAYGRHQDELHNLRQQLGIVTDLDDREYGRHRDDIADEQYREQFDYQRERDEVKDRQWHKKFDYQKERDEELDRQWDQQFEYQKERDSVHDQQWKKQFNEGVRQWEKEFGFQVERAQVMDDQWMQQFNADQQQRAVQNALQSRQISVSEASQALQRSQFELTKEAHDMEMQMIRESAKQSNVDEQTLGSFYHEMTRSDDPAGWLSENGPFLSDDELISLERLIPKEDNTMEILNQLLHGGSHQSR